MHCKAWAEWHTLFRPRCSNTRSIQTLLFTHTVGKKFCVMKQIDHKIPSQCPAGLCRGFSFRSDAQFVSNNWLIQLPNRLPGTVDWSLTLRTTYWKHFHTLYKTLKFTTNSTKLNTGSYFNVTFPHSKLIFFDELQLKTSMKAVVIF